MSRSQVEVLIESIANLHLQLSASLARESELREVNADLAKRLNDYKSSIDSQFNKSNSVELQDLRFIGKE